MGDPQVLVAAVTAAGSVAAAVLAWVSGRRKGAAEAATMASADNREWAAVFLTRLNATEAKLDQAEAELATERKARAEGEAAYQRRVAELEARVAVLEKLVRSLGGVLPGETPPPNRDAREGV